MILKVFEELLKWSKERPAWQRDALRRLVLKSKLNDEDIRELTTICLADVAGGDGVQSEPLSEEHLPSDAATTMAVSLVSIHDVHDVNALSPGGRLELGNTPGLSVVYGANGSGKSGFVRILKQVCRARHRDTKILPNILSSHSGSSNPSARIAYRRGSETFETSWEEGKQGANSPDLAVVSVFDSECATVHVRGQNELAFIPQGLDLLEKLAEACKRVKQVLRAQLAANNLERPASLSRPDVAEALTRSGLGTLTTGVETDNIRRIVELAADELSRHNELRVLLEQDPRAFIASLREREKRLKHLSGSLGRIEAVLGTDAITRIKEMFEEALEREKAAALAAVDLFKESPLPDVGGNVWLRLWEAARSYSEVAYPGTGFPNTAAEARCPLCQQVLSEEARRRLVDFETYVKANARKLADGGWLRLDTEVDRLKTLRLSLKEYTELRSLDGETYASIRHYFGVARLLRCSILRSIKRREWNVVERVLPDSGCFTLTDMLEGIAQKAKRAEESTNPAERARLLQELQKLSARVTLKEIADDLFREAERLKKLSGIERAIEATSTNAITLLSTTLSEQVVTDTLSRQFREELKKLNFKLLDVELASAGGRYGSITHRIQLRHAPNVPVGDVASEGEHRTIALAAFMAELATSESKSAVVFDDPVSSLDHRYRRFVARRLAQEAQERQVVVFTHDIVFLLMLKEFCEEIGNETIYTYLDRSSEGPGLVCGGVPWWAMNVLDRVAYLNNKCADARALYRNGDNEAYRGMAMQIYGLLREAWERAIEEVLLYNTVQRFDRRIQTQRLRVLHDITREDITLIDSAINKCSTYLPGHDEAAAIADPIPEPDELESDIRELKEWTRTMRRDRNRG